MHGDRSDNGGILYYKNSSTHRQVGFAPLKLSCVLWFGSTLKEPRSSDIRIDVEGRALPISEARLTRFTGVWDTGMRLGRFFDAFSEDVRGGESVGS